MSLLRGDSRRAGVRVSGCGLGDAPGIGVRLLRSSGVLGCGGAAWPRRGSGSAPAEHGGVALGRKGGGSVEGWGSWGCGGEV